MSIFHNGKEYGATKVINYSAAPDYNKGVIVDNIQSGNYQATDNGFLTIQLQSQQSNITKVSIIRSKTPITDNTGVEIASRIIQQFQYSETITVQIMAREYYKMIIEGVGNPQVLSCMFYPYASTVPIKLTESIGVEQVEGLETAHVRDLYYNIIDTDSPVTDIKDLPYGWSIIKKELNNMPDYTNFIPQYRYPVIHKYKIKNGGIDTIYDFYSLDDFYYVLYTQKLARGILRDDSFSGWFIENDNLDISIATKVSQVGTFSASQTVLMVENNVIKKVPKGEIVASLPVGFIYMQLRGQSTPDQLFGSSGKWQDISATYAGEFFRAVGGNSGSFGSKQAEGLPNITGRFSSASQYGTVSGAFVKGTGFSGNGSEPSANYPIDFYASRSSSIYGASTHVTPYNSAVRIWKKIA